MYNINNSIYTNFVTLWATGEKNKKDMVDKFFAQTIQIINN